MPVPVQGAILTETDHTTTTTSPAVLPPAGPRAALQRIVDLLLPTILAVVLINLFWYPLVQGGGFIGGDTYNYFFPLKHFYAEGLAANEIRFWHPGIGNGVPTLGESQTGVFYPFYLLAYRFLELNTAYNAVFLTHYILCFLFTFWLAMYLRLGRIESALAALIFTYGWFPPRACLEWAIVTGTWLPLMVLATINWLQTGRSRWAWCLSIVTCVQLLAGHFQLAFVSLLSVVGVALFTSIENVTLQTAWTRRILVLILLGLGYGLAAPQLLPTWELKLRSQRQDDAFTKTVTYGNVPLWYGIQMFLPGEVYPHVDAQLKRVGANTNKIEAHLYFGLIPIGLVLIGVIGLVYRGLIMARPTEKWTSKWWPWLTLLLGGFVLAEGTVFEVLNRLPGFGFFRYPGRYGMMAQLGGAILAAGTVRAILRAGPLASGSLLGLTLLFAMKDSRLSNSIVSQPPFLIAGIACVLITMLFGRMRAIQALVAASVFVFTMIDLQWVSARVQYVQVVNPPIIQMMPASEVFSRLKPTDRILAMDPNTLALSRAACAPTYLGIGPAEYFQIWGSIPDVFHGGTPADAKTINTLATMGITHILTEKPLSADWPVTLLWSGIDSFLHPRMARSRDEPLYLYSFTASRGRAYLTDANKARLPNASVEIAHFSPHKVVIRTKCAQPSDLTLSDMLFPGWRVTIDGQAETVDYSKLLRSVHLAAGDHEVIWSYHPTSFWTGCILAAASFAGLLGLCVIFRAAKKWESPNLTFPAA